MTFWDWALFIGTMGLFTFLFFMFIKVLPMINIFEMRDLLLRINHHDHKANGHDDHHDAGVLAPVTVGGGNGVGGNGHATDGKVGS